MTAQRYDVDALRRLVELGQAMERRRPWLPLPGPQTMAYESQADIIGFGGAAGGGKTDLACGKAITCHRKVMLLRRVGTELTGVIDRFEQLITNKGYNGTLKIWRTVRPGEPNTKLQIELASLPNPGDEKGFQGRDHDLLIFDEASNFLESQVRFLMGWVRTTVKGQKAQVLMTFNPPTSSEGRWIVTFFAPWLDPKHPNPALPGELRWFCTVDGEEIEVASAKPFAWPRRDGKGEEIITPKSRTFIPSRLSDNPHLMATGYMDTLQAMPEPLRSQMLYGDFQAGMTDSEWQVIPTAWVEAAMNRWKPMEPKPEMDSMGVDIARGGIDKTVISTRHGKWYAPLIKFPGSETPTGHEVVAQVLVNVRDGAPIHLDVIGVGASPYDLLTSTKQHVFGVNVAEKATGTDRSGRLRFLNMRTWLWWSMREELDPENDTGIMLPPDAKLKADLCAPIFRLNGPIIVVESRDEIKKRIGRSPDDASAVLLASMDTPKALPGALNRGAACEYDPYAAVKSVVQRDYDPYR